MKISGSRRIAERYVKALFEVADAAKAIGQVEKDLISLGAALEQSADLQAFLTNPLLTRETQAKTMLAVLEKIQVSQVTRQFIGMLVAQKRLPILPAIAELFVEWAINARGEIKGEMIAAAALKPAQVQQVETRLTQAFGRKVNLSVRQDASLLGGVIVKIGSQQLDSSLAGKMRRLSNALKAA